MRAFVTGATGTVGREVCRALRASGVTVRAGVRAPEQAKDILPESIDLVPLDFGSERIDPSSFADTEAFFFMTPLLENQVAASRRVLDAAIEGDVRHVVRLSSRAAGWDHRSELRAWQREVDDAVRGAGVSWTILRPCSFFQNFIRFQAASIRNLSSVIAPQGNGLIAYIDAADIGDAAAECIARPADHNFRTYLLTGGRAYGIKGVAAEIGRFIGKPLTYVSIEERQARDMMLQADMPPWLVEAALAVFAHAREGGEAEVDPALTQILGRPATTLSEFVERNQHAWR